ncbi:hypothetical protein [Notoacmeibacter sp. MSK16QG-6]|uniref:hypothetical protein n=1 Tax=Notoacmeibacter sp. MSK16QG-6 TaxID=2957982 RepID=UPI0020A22EAA|nr:hypothetical protein [Notoacmeibacter sp. MSK16QG-6]MCP1200323.1 hypothetical protein [Notoacmeibacter sp. MSK16QG-6]
MRVVLSFGLFFALGAAAFFADGSRWQSSPSSLDEVVTGSVNEGPTGLYQATVEGEPVRCWLNTQHNEGDYRFVGAECSRLGIEKAGLASVGVERSGDLKVMDRAGKTLLRFFSADGDGWEAAPEAGQLIDLIATFD